MTDKKTEALKPCEYCGHPLPQGVDKRTRQVRSRHFASCKVRLEQKALEEQAALAEQPAQQQEPVAWRSWNDHDGYGFWETKQEAEPWCAPDFFAEPLYTSPPASKPWVGLTKEDRYKAIRPLYCDDATATLAACHSNDEYEAIEAKLKEKNT